jgi:hypothetical protein
VVAAEVLVVLLVLALRGPAHLPPSPSPRTPDAPGSEGREADDLSCWRKEVATLPNYRQVGAVASKLKELNPSFDGQVRPASENWVVLRLEFPADHVGDLRPVRALAGLQTLNCAGSSPGKGRLADLSPLRGLRLSALHCDRTRVTDLSPLAGMPLAVLSCDDTPVADLTPLAGTPLTTLSCARTQVTDLTPLEGTPLTYLDCRGTPVADLSPLRCLPLRELRCDFRPERDGAVLRSMKSLNRVNGRPAARFWREAGDPVPAAPPGCR